MDANGTGKNFTAWAWEQLEDGFLKFLSRKVEEYRLAQKTLRRLEDRWNHFDWGNAAERYKAWMEKNHGYLRVLGKPEPVSWDDIFVGVRFLDKPQTVQRLDMTRLHIQQEPEPLDEGVERRRELDIVAGEKADRLYIVGRQGAGKTTFLKYLVHQTVKGQLKRIPIFVSLMEWAEKKNDGLLKFIGRQFEGCQFPTPEPFVEYILESGQAMVLFDGLDEVNPRERARIVTEMGDFCKKYPAVQAIATCRSLSSEEAFTGFTHVEIADLQKRQIVAYIRNWFSHADKAEQFLRKFRKRENKGVQDFGRNPHLLSLICLAFDETQRIPQNRVVLYEEALDALLKKWDDEVNIPQDETYKNLSPGQKRQLFSSFAAKAFEKGDVFFQKQQLIEEIQACLSTVPPTDARVNLNEEAVLQTIVAQHGLFTEHTSHLYTFSHRSFQEYYTARYMVDHPQRLQSLMPHLNDERWREVFLMAAGLLDKADEFFVAMHRAIGDLIREDQTLMAMQAWVERKAAQIEWFQAGAVRGVYWIFARVLDQTPVLALECAFERANDLTHDPSHHLARELVYDLDLARNSVRALALALDSAGELALERALGFSDDRSFVRDIGEDLELSVARALPRTNALNHDNSLDLAYALNFERVSEFTHALANDLELAMTRTLKFADFLENIPRNEVDRSVVFALAEELVRHLTHAHTNDLAHIFEYDLTLARNYITHRPHARQGGEHLFWDTLLLYAPLFTEIFTRGWKYEAIRALTPQLQQYFHTLHGISQTADPAFAAALEKSPLPVITSRQDYWTQFNQAFRQLVQDSQEIGDGWALNRVQVRLVEQYLQATQLLLDCLDVATVSDRQGILDRVLTVELQ